jgi:hypothetical protein
MRFVNLAAIYLSVISSESLLELSETAPELFNTLVAISAICYSSLDRSSSLSSIPGPSPAELELPLLDVKESLLLRPAFGPESSLEVRLLSWLPLCSR